MSDPAALLSSTRPVRPELAAVVRALEPGQRIRIRQRVRMNSRWGWDTTVEGAFRGVNYLATGLSTDRVPEDDIVVVTVHFTKDNGELSSVTLDESSDIAVKTSRETVNCRTKSVAAWPAPCMMNWGRNWSP